jgi:hypothetical protein
MASHPLLSPLFSFCGGHSKDLSRLDLRDSSELGIESCSLCKNWQLWLSCSLVRVIVCFSLVFPLVPWFLDKLSIYIKTSNFVYRKATKFVSIGNGINNIVYKWCFFLPYMLIIKLVTFQWSTTPQKLDLVLICCWSTKSKHWCIIVSAHSLINVWHLSFVLIL